MIPTSIDGTDITGATIDGTDVTEITVDGDTVFTAAPDIPDSGDLHAHYDATLLSLSDGDSVSTWADASGNGHDLTQGTATEQPTYKTNVINGKPVVRHDGSDDYLQVAFSSISQPNHIFAVFQHRDATGGYAYGGGSSSTRHDIAITTDTFEYFIHSGVTFRSGVTGDTSPHIFANLYNGGSSKIRFDGADQATGNAGSDNLDGFKTGVFGGGTTAFGEVDIAEILIYPQDKTSIVSDVDSYLSDKWGITI